MSEASSGDLFTPPTSDLDAAQDLLRQAMIASHLQDLQDLKQRGIRPPWQESQIILQEDEYRLLSLIDENISLRLDQYTLEETESTSDLFGSLPQFKMRRNVTKEIGMNADNNSAAVINRCLAQGWIVEVVNEGKRYLELTDAGQDVVWDYEQDRDEF